MKKKKEKKEGKKQQQITMNNAFKQVNIFDGID